MKIVKLTFNYDWPIFRQTPNYSQIWGDYKFVIDDRLEECDFWVVFTHYKLTAEKVICNPKSIIYIVGEGYHTSPRFGKRFLDQFGLIVTVQKELIHKKAIYKLNPLPWFVGKSYDELYGSQVRNKTKLISVIASNKILTEGHQKRFDFVKELKKHFGDKLDVYGRGINEVNDKWDALADYKYSIAIENDYCEDYVTEKYFDCLYSNTLPFYYGCPNLEKYVNKESFIRIDIDDIEKSIHTIENSIKNHEYESKIELLESEKLRSLNNDQFFPLIVSFLSNINSNKKKKRITLNPNPSSEYIIKRIKNKLLRRILR